MWFLILSQRRTFFAVRVGQQTEHLWKIISANVYAL